MEHYSAMDIAKYVVTYCTNKKKPISNLKLQKMLYFLWIEFYKEKKEMLFHEEPFYAWQFGPVIENVYYEFCSYVGAPISERYEVSIKSSDKSLIDEIIDKFIDWPVGKLIDRSHIDGGAWKKAYKSGERKLISFDDIIKLECSNAI